MYHLLHIKDRAMNKNKKIFFDDFIIFSYSYSSYLSNMHLFGEKTTYGLFPTHSLVRKAKVRWQNTGTFSASAMHFCTKIFFFWRRIDDPVMASFLYLFKWDMDMNIFRSTFNQENIKFVFLNKNLRMLGRLAGRKGDNFDDQQCPWMWRYGDFP